ncbi:MAG TPA: hypothetical protein PLV87_18130, partial [Opitutaceae bacterium]|nr:hypothetical protein [Opitutaceae bacterium]
MRDYLHRFVAWACVELGVIAGMGTAFAKEVPPPVVLGKDGALEYVRAANGDVLPDYSHAGYRGGGVRFPDLFARVRVAPVEGDDGARIQAAIDLVSKLPLDKKGVRGAVQLEAGRYEIEGNIRLSASGVVLRGAGSGERGTTLVAAGSDRRALIVVSGAEEGRLGRPLFAVADDHVPVGSRRMRLKPVGLEGEKTTSKSDARPRLESGMRLRIERPSSQEWIHALGMDESPARQPYSWKVGAFNVV